MQTDVQLLQSVFLVPLTLLPIINPVGNVPIFTALSGGNPAIAAPMALWPAMRTRETSVTRPNHHQTQVTPAAAARTETAVDAT